MCKCYEWHAYFYYGMKFVSFIPIFVLPNQRWCRRTALDLSRIASTVDAKIHCTATSVVEFENA